MKIFHKISDKDIFNSIFHDIKFDENLKVRNKVLELLRILITKMYNTEYYWKIKNLKNGIEIVLKF